jgi:hypothetical protein
MIGKRLAMRKEKGPTQPLLDEYGSSPNDW